MSFSDFALPSQVLKALEQEGYTEATPIQAEALPIVLSGRDLIGSAQTGTGKTAAFMLGWLVVAVLGVRRLLQ